MKAIAKQLVDKLKFKKGNKKLSVPPKIPSLLNLELPPVLEAVLPVVQPIVEVSSLIGHVNIPLRIINLSLSANASSTWQKNHNAYTFKKEIILCKGINKYTEYLSTISYRPDGLGYDYQVTLPNSFLVQRLSPEEEEKVLDEIAINIMKDMNKNLPGATNKNTGADPEIFVEDEHGVVIPAFSFLGSKEKPDTTPIDGRQSGAGGQKMYWDGFQAEFTVYATGCIAYVLDSIYLGLLGVHQKATKFNAKAKLSSKTVMDIPEPMLLESKDEHVQFGCMPSHNAYGIGGEKANGRDVPFRPAGGHIHFGIGKLSMEVNTKIVKALDAILGVACVSLFDRLDDVRRRRLYGLPGEFRLPPHGLEYRTLSNAWMFHPVLNMIVFDLARRIVQVGENNLLKYWQTNEAETIRCIQECDVIKAREILERNKKMMIDIIFACYNETSYPPQTRDDAALLFKCIMEGAHSFLKDPTDITNNWNLADGKWIFHNRGHVYEEGRHWVASSKAIKEGRKV